MENKRELNFYLNCTFFINLKVSEKKIKEKFQLRNINIKKNDYEILLLFVEFIAF